MPKDKLSAISVCRAWDTSLERLAAGDTSMSHLSVSTNGAFASCPVYRRRAAVMNRAVAAAVAAASFWSQPGARAPSRMVPVTGRVELASRCSIAARGGWEEAFARAVSASAFAAWAVGMSAAAMSAEKSAAAPAEKPTADGDIFHATRCSRLQRNTCKHTTSPWVSRAFWAEPVRHSGPSPLAPAPVIMADATFAETSRRAA